MTKDQIQDKCLELSEIHNNLILSIATGVGKTLAALRIMKKFGGRWYIVVAETNHIKNWHDEIIKHGYQDLLMSLDIFCYASLHKYEKTEVIGIVLDEGHHTDTEIRLSYLGTIKTQHIICLTATLPTDTKNILNFYFGDFYEYKYSLSQAIKDGILPEPKIYLVDIELPTTMTEYVILKGNKNNRKVLHCSVHQMIELLSLHNSLELHVSCTEKEKYDLLEKDLNYARETYFKVYNDPMSSRGTKEFYKNKWLNIGSQRKRFMAAVKTPAARTILNLIKDHKHICFTGSIEQANQLAYSKELIVNSYKTKLENSKIITNFNENRINALFATGMLKEGMNLSGIGTGLIIQLDNQTKSLIQMLGRLLRSEMPIIYVLYIKDTQDEKYLQTAFAGFNKDYLYYTNINEL